MKTKEKDYSKWGLFVAGVVVGMFATAIYFGKTG